MHPSSDKKPNHHVILWILGSSSVIFLDAMIVMLLVVENAAFTMTRHVRPAVRQALSVSYATPITWTPGPDGYKSGIVVGTIPSKRDRSATKKEGIFQECNSDCTQMPGKEVTTLPHFSLEFKARLASHGQKDESQSSRIIWSALHDESVCYVKRQHTMRASIPNDTAACMSMSTGAYVYAFGEF